MTVRIIPLGGLGEMGRNSLLIEGEREAFVIDGGMMLPEDYMVGVDAVIPDFSIIDVIGDKLKAVLLTHGHEDHIGGVPYLLERAMVPVYGTELTLALLKSKLDERQMDVDGLFVGFDPGETIRFDEFEFTPFPVPHSIPGGVGFVVRTPDGVVVHSGDFKFVDGFEDQAVGILEEAGREGVSLLLSDSVNAEVEGYAGSETEVGESISEIMRDTRGRFIIATFSSNLTRIAEVMNAATRHGRRVFVAGRSMERTIEIGRRLGYIPPGTEVPVLDVSRAGRFPDDEVVLITTGAQGEPFSALFLVSQNQHKHITLRKGDTVVLSARMIPGNERAVGRLIDGLCRQGARVIYQGVGTVHVSGHGCRGDLAELIRLVRPDCLLPIHGEYRQLVKHGELAREMGVKHVLIAETGDVLELENGSVSMNGEISLRRVMIDGNGVGDVDDVVLKERRDASRSGVVVVVIGVTVDGEIDFGPMILAHGLTDEAGREKLISSAREELKDHLAGILDELDPQELREEMRLFLRRFFKRHLQRKPVVLPVVVER